MKVLRLSGIVRLPDDFSGDMKAALSFLAEVKQAGVVDLVEPPPEEVARGKQALEALGDYQWPRFVEAQARGNPMAMNATISEWDGERWIDHGQRVPFSS